MGRWALALVIAMAVLGVAAPAQAQTPLPTISLIDENMCWDDWACGNWLWGVIQPPDARGRPNPFVMYACTITPLVGTDAESCIADLANRTGAASYPVCLWDTGNLPGHFPECPAYSAADFQRYYPDLNPREWCGSSGCRPPSIRREMGVMDYYRRQDARGAR